MPHPLAAVVARLERRIKALERGARLRNASLEATTLPVYDSDGTLRTVIGQQPDGTYTVTDHNAPMPFTPSDAMIFERPGVLIVTWAGTFASDSAAPADFSHVEVHVSEQHDDAGWFEPTDANQVATIHSLKGGSVTLALPQVQHSVILQAVNTSRVESPPSVPSLGTPLPVAMSGGAKTFGGNEPPIGLTGDDEGSLWYDENDGRKLYRWDGAFWQPFQFGPGALADDAVTTPKIADQAVTTVQLGDQAVDLAKLADGSVDAAKLVLDAVQAQHIATDAVTTDAIAAGAVTTVQIGDQAVDLFKLADGSVDARKLVADAVQATHLAPGSVTNNAIAAGTISQDRLGFTIEAGGVTITYGPAPHPAPDVDDLWYDTTLGNRPSRWDGTSWQPFTFGNAAVANNAITEDKIADFSVPVTKFLSTQHYLY